jgi:molybdate transport system ATP-binding protein
MSAEEIRARFKLAYGDFTLEVDLTMPGRGVSALFGPSGSGKTTLLRCIAGLARAPQGYLSVGDEVWQDGEVFVPTHKRAVGYVFQDASLLPHLSVRRNLDFGWRRTARHERKLELEHAVELLGLTRILDRSDPSALSGGERQRVAIGRALLTHPRLLLMDEPISSLDAASKDEILPYLERLHDALDIPVIYVSHSIDEVARLADHLVLIEAGKVAASDALSTIQSRLDLAFAHVDESGTVIDAVVALHDDAYALSRMDFAGGQLWASRIARAPGERVRARVLARDVSIALVPPQGSSISNILPARIAEIEATGADRVTVRLLVGEQTTLLSRITRRSRDELGLAVGMNVHAQIKSVAVRRSNS